MKLYDDYVDWASKKMVKHIIIPVFPTVHKIAQKLVPINRSIYDKTGIDIFGIENKDEIID